jgi:hypothetical protein
VSEKLLDYYLTAMKPLQHSARGKKKELRFFFSLGKER